MGKSLRRLVREITGKEVVIVKVPFWYFIYPEQMEVQGGRGKKEKVIHEVCHWVVAEDWQRNHPTNLGFGHSSDGYDGKDPRCTAGFLARQENMTCHLQALLYRTQGRRLPDSNTSSPIRDGAPSRKLAPSDLVWVLERAGEVGLERLVEMVTARW